VLRRTLLFSDVRVKSFSTIDGAVVLPLVKIERNVRLKKVVIDRGVRIPQGLVVGEDPELDAQRFRRSDNGVCLITKAMIDRLR
jgi:glucose-1-phosphate adenylyltransferase